jgi:hypothetical protein
MCWSDRLLRTGASAFLAAFALVGVIDVNVPVPVNRGFAKHAARAGFDAFPACLASSDVHLDKLGVIVIVKGEMDFHRYLA